jgi:hypothetical protein
MFTYGLEYNYKMAFAASVTRTNATAAMGALAELPSDSALPLGSRVMGALFSSVQNTFWVLTTVAWA